VPIFTNFNNSGETTMAKKNDVDPKSAGVSKAKAKVADLTPEERELLVIKIVALCWEQFGRGAGRAKVLPECFDKAVELGALANVRKNLDILGEFGKNFRLVQKCSLEAGQYALAHAIPDLDPTKPPSITPAVYEAAFIAGSPPPPPPGSGKVDAQGMLC
jgi:hypothetical protein